MNTTLELSPSQLYFPIDPQTLDITATEQLTPINGIVGQPRAVAALRFGLEIHDNGFNLYVAGPAGIGKMTAVRTFVEQLASTKAVPPDWCYVNNFDDPYQPKMYQVAGWAWSPAPAGYAAGDRSDAPCHPRGLRERGVYEPS